MDRQRQRHRHGPHLEVGLIHADDLLLELLERLVHPIENRVVFDLGHEDQARLRNLERSGSRKRDAKFFGRFEGQSEPELAAERAQDFVETQSRCVLEALR